MFERFTGEARHAVVEAQEAARRLGTDHIGSEHLLLGAAATDGSVAAHALDRLGIGLEALTAAVRALPVDALDAEALATVGVDLEAVRAQTEAAFGEGALDAPSPARRRRRKVASHIPFDGHAKKTLEISLREAIRLDHRHIDTGHLLLAVARLDETPAHCALRELGAEPEAVREAVAASREGLSAG